MLLLYAFFLTGALGYGTIFSDETRRCDEMADVADLKSAGSDTMPVRVRPAAPKAHNPNRSGYLFDSQRVRIFVIILYIDGQAMKSILNSIGKRYNNLLLFLVII